MAGSDHRNFDDMGNGEAGCQAGPLKDALDQLAARIADADSRHAATLRELQERVIALGDRAMATRAALPPRYAAAFERVEEAMSALAERLSESDTERAATHVAPALAASPARAIATDPDHADAFADEAARDVRRAMGRFEPQPQSPTAPPALRSAMSAPGDWVRVEPPAATENETDQGAHRNSELDAMWEPQAADALARHFHQDEQDMPVTAPDWPGIDEPAVAASAQLGLKAPVVQSAKASAIEQTWLEDKLAEVASRVEQSLAEINPQNSFLALGERFDQFEQRFGSALDDVATRHDLEGLRLVEGQIGELFSHLDRTQAQLGRLDVIEEQLEDLRVRLSDENLAQLVGAGGATPDDNHLMAIADAAAERVAMQMGERMHAIAPSGQQPDGGATEHAVAELAGMLQDYMSERRNGDANAAEALDTLQQAMQQLLDRLEALEAQQVQAPAAPHASTHDFAAQRAAPVTNRYDEVVHDAPSTGPRSVVEQARAAARAASASSRPTLRVAEDDTQDRYQDPPRDDFARRNAEVASQDARSDAPTWTQSNSDNDRKAFIAMARRAAERASSGGVVSAPEPTLETPRTSATAGLRQRLTGGDTASAAGSSRGIRPGVFMVASLAAFLLAGYWLISATKFRSLMPGASVERRIPTAAPSRANAPTGLSQQPPGLPTPAARSPQGATPPAAAPGESVPGKGASGATEEHGSAPESTSPARSSSLDSGTHGRIYERGIAVDGGSPQVDPDALERARRQVELASQSTRLGMQAARDTPTLQTAAARELREAIGSDAPTASSAPTTGSRVIEMPPATIAPLSVRMAASKGDANAQLEIATRFAEGKGVPQDFAQAAVWYQRAATSGLPAAQYRLAALYERGLGVTADVARARVWYKRAAEQGNVRAMHNLAVLSASRAGGSPDYPAAVQWFTEAAKRGLADSQYNLGILSESGLGVPANAIDAYKWYSLAARSGDKEAMRRRDLIKAKLKPGDLRAADALVISWRALPIEGRANDPQAGNLAWRGSATSKR